MSTKYSNISSPITFFGGKKTLAKKIVSIIPEHRMYCEPFFGGGAVFFAKAPSYLECINDTNDRLITFYQVLQEKYRDLARVIRNTPHSERYGNLARDIYNKRIKYDDLGMAWAVWMMTNGNFTGSPHGSWKWCNGSAGSHTGRVLNKKRNELTDIYFNRIKHVQISCRDALRCIADRDGEETIFYLDPPYPGANQKHYGGYTMKDFIELLDLLEGIKGKFILSNYWSQTLRYRILSNTWYYIAIKGNIQVNNLNHGPVTIEKVEILAMNFKPPTIDAEAQKLF